VISDSGAPTGTDNRTEIRYCSQISGLTCGAPHALTQRAALFSEDFPGARADINSARAQALTRRAGLALGRRAALFSSAVFVARAGINSARHTVSRAIFIARADINSARRTDISSGR